MSGGRTGSKARAGAAKRRRPRRKPASGPTPERPSRARWIAVALALVAGLASTGLFLLYPMERGPGEGGAVEVVIPPSPSASDLAAILSAAGVVVHPRLFALWVRATGGADAVAAGMHLLTDDATPRQLMARLERRSGGGSVHVTFPEGWTRFDMARRLEDRHVVSLREFLDATADAGLLHDLGLTGDTAEGFLFPATYDLPLDSDARDVVRRMKREFDHRWDVVSHAHSATLNDVMTSASLGVRDVVTLASMVEKEAAVDEERPLIASVFLNRLRDPTFHPKRLECDPTASYGCLVAPEKATSCAVFTGKATAAIEHDPDNPYSTYTHEGLPPGPIANPGARALEAVMAPATTHYFYFVARGDGHSTFSETYEAHAGAVRDGGRAAPPLETRKSPEHAGSTL
jgi:UPF0755 protein